MQLYISNNLKVYYIINLAFFCWLTIFSDLVYGQASTVYIWDEAPPNSITNSSYRQKISYYTDGSVKSIGQISDPKIEIFLPDSDSNGIGVLIFPGGGYKYVAIKKEGYDVAKALNKMGYTAFVLSYRLPSNDIMHDKSIGPLMDAQEAFRLIKSKLDEYDIQLNKLGVLGFSAGGHLAASLHAKYNENIYTSKYEITARPDFSVLIYPVISMNDEIAHEGSKHSLLGFNSTKLQEDNFSIELNTNTDVSPVFLVHASDDSSVSVQNSLRYYNSLNRKGVPVALHIYQNGGHGFGLGNNTENKRWLYDLDAWIESQFLNN